MINFRYFVIFFHINLIFYYKVISTDFSFYYFDQNKEQICINLSSMKSSKPIINNEKLQGESVSLYTKSGIKFSGLFFNRNSDKIIIAGQGFPGSKESMIYVAKLFPCYDVFVFDYRWRNLPSFCLKSSTILHPIENFILREKEKAEAALAYCKCVKNYEEVIGLVTCYSNFTFAALQAEAEINNSDIRFTKLICDSMFSCFESFAENISKDPLIPMYPQTGKCPSFIRSFLSKKYVNNPILWLVKFFLPKVSIETYLRSLFNTPILFIHGKSDLLVDFEKHFLNQIWKWTKSENKVAFITPFQHADNDYNQAIYRDVCELFINSDSIPNFIRKINIIF